MTQRITEVQIRPESLGLSRQRSTWTTTKCGRRLSRQRVSVARYPEASARVEGRAVAWTSRALCVEWVDGNGERQCGCGPGGR